MPDEPAGYLVGVYKRPEAVIVNLYRTVPGGKPEKVFSGMSLTDGAYAEQEALLGILREIKHEMDGGRLAEELTPLTGIGALSEVMAGVLREIGYPAGLASASAQAMANQAVAQLVRSGGVAGELGGGGEAN